MQINGQKYQILEAAPTLNGLRMITYYPLREMLRPVRNIAGITSGFLAVLMLVGLLFMILFYKNILLQFKILTEHLKQVENGNFETQITELPNNEFAYVFEQFNRMVERIRHLISSTLKEQQLRNQAEMRQLQLLITDIRMPRVSGLDLVRMIDEEKFDTKVIILSGYSEFEYAKQAVHYGVSEYLVKPVLKEALEEALQNVLHKNFKDTPVVEKDREGTSGDSQDIIPFIKSYVYENFDKDLSLDHLGQVVHLHPAYLSKVFKDETDMNEYN